MAKNIVIVCDGTGQSYRKTESNPLRLYKFLLKDEASRQIVCYNPGIGTFPHPLGFHVGRHIRRLLELGLGSGLMEDLPKLYAILMRQYEPGDTVFLFGFSRGAFTVRALAAMIHVCGLLRPDDLPLLPHAMELFRTSESRIGEAKRAAGIDPKFPQNDHAKFDELAMRFKADFSRECPIDFLGLWDTVKAYGFFRPRSFPCLRHNPSVSIVRHAVALDEQRSHFQVTGWGDRDDHNTKVKEVWFTGDHSDVGGGHDGGDNLLSDLTLSWMIGEATNCPCKVLLDPKKQEEVNALWNRTKKASTSTAANLDCGYQWWLSRCPRPELDNSGYPPERPWRLRPSARREPLCHRENGILRYHQSVPASVGRVEGFEEEETHDAVWQ